MRLALSGWALVLLFPALANAHSYIKIEASGPGAAGIAYCTFPDGTHPKRVGVHCYEPGPFLAAYGIDELHKRGVTGKGQVIILLDAFGSPTMQADLDTFSDTFHLPRKTIQFIYPNGPYLNPLTKPDPNDPSKQVPDDDKIGWAGETTLDLEWAHAIAPDAELVNVVTNVSETEGMAGLPELFHGIEMAADQYPGGIISMSFGTGEPTFTGAEVTDQLRGALHRTLDRATRAGMTLLAATGDSGTANLNLAMTSMMDIRSTGYPASDPLVTAVGGTALEYGWKWTPQGTIGDYFDCKSRQGQQRLIDAKAKPADCPFDILSAVDVPGGRIETAWKEDWALAAGGGGISQVFRMPRYQKGLPPSVLLTARGHRTIPDISMNAAVNGGVMTYASYIEPGKEHQVQWSSIGGTSAATPEMAALVALAGQRASDLAGHAVAIGSLNRFLYGLSAADFRDIQSQRFGAQGQVDVSDNGLYFSPLALQLLGPTSVTPVLVPGYETTAGYDIATGLGSPVADRLVEDLAQARVGVEGPSFR